MNTVDYGGPDTDMYIASYFHRAAERNAGGQMRVIADDIVMFHNGAGIDDTVATDPCARVDDGVCEHDRTRSDFCFACDRCGGMNQCMLMLLHLPRNKITVFKLFKNI